MSRKEEEEDEEDYKHELSKKNPHRLNPAKRGDRDFSLFSCLVTTEYVVMHACWFG